MTQAGASEYQYDSPGAAIAAFNAALKPLDTERVALAESPGRILAESILTDRPTPAVDVSAMDGYAVRLADLFRGVHAIAGDIAIGQQPPAFPSRGLLRIVTGAPVPGGADAVIKREDVLEAPDSITVTDATLRTVKPGANIRRRGENAAQGASVAAPGRVIDAVLAGALASFGYPHPLVFRRVRVGILITGDEIVDAAETPSPWRIRDSNGSALTALLAGPRWLDVAPARRAPDHPTLLRSTIASLLETSDALILTGGVSMGQRDFIPSVLESMGARTLFHRLPQRPGKPVLGAILPGGKPVLALPGNPVSVMVTARRMGAPALAHLGGLTSLPPPLLVRLANPDARTLHLWWQRPARLASPGLAELVDSKGSGDVVSAARSDGFVELPPEQSGEGPWPYYPWRL